MISLLPSPGGRSRSSSSSLGDLASNYRLPSRMSSGYSRVSGWP